MFCLYLLDKFVLHIHTSQRWQLYISSENQVGTHTKTSSPYICEAKRLAEYENLQENNFFEKIHCYATSNIVRYFLVLDNS